MPKTAFSKKCEILGSLWWKKDKVPQTKDWKEFFSWSDVALPMSYMLWLDMITIKEGPTNPKLFIDEAWEKLCELLSIDPELEYDSLDDILP